MIESAVLLLVLLTIYTYPIGFATCGFIWYLLIMRVFFPHVTIKP